MATSFLLKPNITLNPLTNQYSIIQLSPVYKPFAKSPNFPRLISNPKLTVKCSASTENLNKTVLNPVNKETKTNPYEVFANAVLESLKPFQDTLNSVTVVLFMMVTWLCTVKSALAASGGRMGGRSFSSSSKSSSSSGSSSSYKSPSPSYSSPSPSYSSPSPSYSSPSPSYSSPSPSYDSYSSPSPSYSSPSPSYTSRSPSPSYRSPPSYSSPSSSPSFWSSPSAPSVEVTVVKSSPSKSAPSKSETLVESVSINSSPPPITKQNSDIWGTINVCIISASVIYLALNYAGSRNPNPASGSSVIKLQVGLLGLARSLQRDLDQIAETSDTSKKEGLSYILTETTLAILRHPDYCISGYSSVQVKNNEGDVETLFDRLCIEERAKLDEETLVNVDNRKKQRKNSKDASGFNNEYIVITIIVAAEGVYKLPNISSIEDLKETLKVLGSISTNKTLAVEVLWTPQSKNDTLTEQEMIEEYPLLRLYT